MKLIFPDSFFVDLFKNDTHPDLANSKENAPCVLTEAARTTIKGKELAELTLSSPFYGFAYSFFNNDKAPQLGVAFNLFKESPGPVFDSDRVFALRNFVENTRIIEFQGFPSLCESLLGPSENDETTIKIVQVCTPTFETFFPPDPSSGSSDRDSLSSKPRVSEEELEKLRNNEVSPLPLTTVKKIILVPPLVLAAISLEHPTDYDAIIKSACEALNDTASKINDPNDRKDFLHVSFRLIQLLWLHAQAAPEDVEAPIVDFTHLKHNFESSEDDWAEWKMESLATIVESCRQSAASATAFLAATPAPKTPLKHPAAAPPSTRPSPAAFVFNSEEAACLLNRSMEVLQASMDIQEKSPSMSNSRQILSSDNFAYNAFLIAGSPDGINPADDISDPLKRVIVQNKSVARTNIINQLNHIAGESSMLVDQALANAVRSLHIFRLHSETMGRFSLMLCTLRSVQELTAEMDDHELHTRINMKSLNSNMLEKVFESRPDFAFDAATWTETMENFSTFIQFLWTEESVIHQVARKLITVVKTHRTRINSMARGNKFFIPTFFWKINNHFHSWLNSCKTASTCPEANWNSIRSLPEEIDTLLGEHERPMVELPFEVKALVSASYDKKFGTIKHKPGPNDPLNAHGGNEFFKNGDGSPGAKKQKIDGNGSPGVAKDPNKHNPKVPKDWKMEPHIFRKIITPKASDLPQQNGKAICALFHILGKCSRGKNCPHSHDNLSQSTKQALTTFITARKEENGML